MPAIQVFVRSMLITSVCVLALCAPVQAAEEPVNPRKTWQLLDYIAIDYTGAAKDGRVVSAVEFAEMQEFSADAANKNSLRN